ncbi:hypothetical protein ALTERO38_90137 [Alteromonas sp. 38]|nr:hypothetical protein ALTER154_10310 [Alteromonas sp. 154]VXC49211.1 hypothetical protein ALTERO38_90137 [Alteromonas sp. 38]
MTVEVTEYECVNELVSSALIEKAIARSNTSDIAFSMVKSFCIHA